MSEIGKIQSALNGKSTSSRSLKILNELREISAGIKNASLQVQIREAAPQQTDNSPYLQDRAYSNPLAIKGSALETKWKDVPTANENNPMWLKHDSETTQETLVVINRQKLNII